MYNNYVLITIVIIAVILYYFYTKEDLVDNNKILLLYYLPTCGHCKEFMPVWNNIKSGLPITTKEINCSENNELCNRDNIEGVPTIRLVTSNKVIEYDGNRDYENIVNFVKNN